MECKLCKKRLVPIGKNRTNGKDQNDWKGRQYHKKCWVQFNKLGWINRYINEVFKMERPKNEIYEENKEND